MEINKLKNKSIIVLGFGREGESSLKFLQKYCLGKKIAIADQMELNNLSGRQKNLLKEKESIKLHFGKDYLRALKQYNVIIKSPGISNKTIAPYITKKQIITSQTEIFLKKHRGNTIGVTGTKGKGTTASLIYKILKESGLKAELIGNIGTPVLDFFHKNSIFVYELSSHQLQNLKISPHIAVFLNIYPEHLDYYKNFQEYFNAKKNIVKWQNAKKEFYSKSCQIEKTGRKTASVLDGERRLSGDCPFFVFNNDFKELKELAKKSKAIKKTFGKTKTNNCFFDSKNIFLQTKRSVNFRSSQAWKVGKFPRKNIPLKGEHFVYDVMAAILVANIFKIKESSIKKSIKEFKGLPHRLEFVGEYKKIKFYNDSLATIPEATIYALDALRNIDTLILGGFDRGVDFNKLAQKIKQKNINNFIFFPSSGKRIWQEIIKQKPNNNPEYFFVNNMKEAVKIAFKNTQKGKLCLLSSASPSFGIFKDYADRGYQFKKCIHNAKLQIGCEKCERFG